MRFHNGSDFTAEDVAFTFERIPTVREQPRVLPHLHAGRHARWRWSIPTRCAFRTNGPAPLLPTDLAQVPMLDRETHQGATTEDFNSGRVAIGTGPFRMAMHRPGDRIELQRNDAYWGSRAAWQRSTTA